MISEEQQIHSHDGGYQQHDVKDGRRLASHFSPNSNIEIVGRVALAAEAAFAVGTYITSA
jgi:hypothetical protein